MTARYDSARPRVVRTSPANGATGVRASLSHISIWFDQPMAEEMMVDPLLEDSGATFPEIAGKGTLDESRTVVTLPVHLAPAHAYALVLDARYGRGFRSESGVPLTRVVLRFRTRD